MKKIIYSIIAILLLCGGSFYGGYEAGRKCYFEGYRFVRGESIAEEVEIPAPVEIVPETPSLPLKTDTVYVDSIQIVKITVDTAQIIREYEMKRKYTIPVVDNREVGKLTIDAEVQYNKITSLAYDFEPIYREVIYKNGKPFKPFISASYSTDETIGVGGGLFYKNTGFLYEILKKTGNNNLIENNNISLYHRFGVLHIF